MYSKGWGFAGGGAASMAVCAMLLLPGCKVIDAPESIEELMIFGFMHADEEEEGYGTAFLTNLLPEIDANTEDLEAGYRVNSLTADDIRASLEDPDGIDDDVDITGVSTRTIHQSSMADVVWALSFPDTTQVFDATIVFELGDHTDRDCFLLRACIDYTYSAHRVLDLGILGQATQDFSGSFRWVTAEDGTEGALWRTTSPRPAETTSDIMSVHQQYSMDVLFDNGDGSSSRMSAIWIDATLGEEGDIPDSFLVNTSVKQLQDAAGDVDLFITENRDKDPDTIQTDAGAEEKGCSTVSRAGTYPSAIWLGVVGLLIGLRRR